MALELHNMIFVQLQKLHTFPTECVHARYPCTFQQQKKIIFDRKNINWLRMMMNFEDIMEFAVL